MLTKNSHNKGFWLLLTIFSVSKRECDYYASKHDNFCLEMWTIFENRMPY